MWKRECDILLVSNVPLLQASLDNNRRKHHWKEDDKLGYSSNTNVREEVIKTNQTWFVKGLEL